MIGVSIIAAFNKITLLNVFSIIYMTALIIIYLSKQRLQNRENKCYTWFIFCNIIGLGLQLMCDFVTQNSHVIPYTLIIIILKIYLVHFIIYLSLITRYLMIVVVGDKNKWVYMMNTIVYVILGVIILILPINFYFDSNTLISYSYGSGVNYTFYVSFAISVILLFLLIFNRKKIPIKKAIPLYSFIVFGIVCGRIQQLMPELTLMGCAESLICFIMYFTIENPDVKMLQQVEAERDRADRANQAKSDFLSSMSHEIRTPLNAIVGFSECVMQSDTLDEAKENANDIVGASQTLLEIVNGILDISKIESGKIELIENDYDPYKMLNETVKLAKGRLGDKPLDFNVNIAQDIPKVLYGDRFNIKKILINFLTNAIKYTDEGYVNFDVKCVKLNGYVRLIFTVQDSGRGIKKEDINKLFTKFQRLDEEKNQTIEGTGLGLAITKQLVDMMKGKVVVDSVYGEGSKFTFVLDQKVSNVVLESTTQKMDVVVDLTGKKILVVDDNKLNLKVADKLLKNYNVAITLCNSGTDCLDLINNGNRFDLILLDDMMPGMSGTETLHHLKENPNFNIPVVALTANAINGMKEKYLSEGFDGYLAKPIERPELYRTLVKFLNVITEEEKEEIKAEAPVEETKENEEEKTQILKVDEVVPRISKVGDIPKYVPDNQEIVINPGDGEKKQPKNTKKAAEKTNNNGDIRILLVDDNNLNIKVESKLIDALGYKVDAAYSGIEAIRKIEETNYDLIFMDIMMPMLDGVQTYHELKKLEGFDIPTVALTADAVLGARDKYLSEGFDEYITKPCNKEEFDKIITRFIKK
jgi:CheY-like chemotaxis protein